MAADQNDTALEKLRAFVMERGGSVQPGHLSPLFAEDEGCSRLLRGKVKSLMRERPRCGLVFDSGLTKKKPWIRAVTRRKGKVHKPHICAAEGTPARQGASQSSDTPSRQRTFLPSGVEYDLISSLGRLHELIATDVALRGQDQSFVAICCESVPEVLQLMQIATAQGVAVIDCCTIGARVVCEALSPLLTSSKTLKLMHDLETAAAAIRTLGGVALQGCLDSQLCMEAVTGDVHVGFNAMLAALGLEAHPTERKVHARMEAWNLLATSPVPADLVAYAATNAALLYDAAAALAGRLKENGVPTPALRVASDARAFLAMPSGAECWADAARRRRVCFDTMHGHRMVSSELIEAWRPADLYTTTPLAASGMP